MSSSGNSNLWMIVLSMLLIVLLITISSIYSAYSLPISPQQQPIPKLDFDDPARSIVVVLQLEKASPLPTDIEKATLMSIEISPERARTHLGDPPLLKVVLIGKNNLVKDQFTTWSPLWVFSYSQNGQEQLNNLKIANGSIVIPFDRALAFMELYSLPTGKFITRINLNATVESFCKDNPTDPNCKPIVVNKFCKDNPTDPNCKPSIRITFCKEHPEDPRCKRFPGSFQTNLTNSSLANSTGLINSSLPNSKK